MADAIVAVSGKQVSREDLKYVAEPLKTFNPETETPVNLIFEGTGIPEIVQTIAVTVRPVEVAILLAIAKVVLEEGIRRAIKIFSKRAGRHTFYMDFRIGKMEGRVLVESSDVKMIDKAMKHANRKFERAVKLMADPSFPHDTLGVGVEFDEKVGDFRIRQKSGSGENLEYDERTGTWK